MGSEYNMPLLYKKRLCIIRTICARHHVEGVGSGPAKHAEISEIVRSRHEQHNVDYYNEAQEGEELLVITPIIDGKLVGH